MKKVNLNAHKSGLYDYQLDLYNNNLCIGNLILAEECSQYNYIVTGKHKKLIQLYLDYLKASEISGKYVEERIKEILLKINENSRLAGLEYDILINVTHKINETFKFDIIAEFEYFRIKKSCNELKLKEFSMYYSQKENSFIRNYFNVSIDEAKPTYDDIFDWRKIK